MVEIEEIKNKLWDSVTSYEGLLEERYRFFELLDKLIIKSRSELIKDYIKNPQNIPLSIKQSVESLEGS